MNSGLYGIIWQDLVVFRRKFWGSSMAMIVSPLLYLLAFGFGLGSSVVIEGKPYIYFMIPGLIALNSMSVSFSTTANNINIAKIFYKTFENYLMAPISLGTIITGKILVGALRGFYSAMLILALSLAFQVSPGLTIYKIGIISLNCLVFSSVGFLAGLLVKSHSDMAKFTNFVITPMSFLCGTFFSLDSMPLPIKRMIELLPLTQASYGMRLQDATFLQSAIPLVTLSGYFFVLYFVNKRVLKQMES